MTSIARTRIQSRLKQNRKQGSIYMVYRTIYVVYRTMQDSQIESMHAYTRACMRGWISSQPNSNDASNLRVTAIILKAKSIPYFHMYVDLFVFITLLFMAAMMTLVVALQRQHGGSTYLRHGAYDSNHTENFQIGLLLIKHPVCNKARWHQSLRCWSSV